MRLVVPRMLTCARHGWINLPRHAVAVNLHRWWEFCGDSREPSPALLCSECPVSLLEGMPFCLVLGVGEYKEVLDIVLGEGHGQLGRGECRLDVHTHRAEPLCVQEHTIELHRFLIHDASLF